MWAGPIHRGPPVSQTKQLESIGKLLKRKQRNDMGRPILDRSILFQVSYVAGCSEDGFDGIGPEAKGPVRRLLSGASGWLSC